MFQKAKFYNAQNVENEYGEITKSPVFSFSTGVETKTVSFKDKISGGQKTSGVSLYVYARRNTRTMGVVVGDRIQLGNDTQFFEIVGVDPSHGNKQIVFLADWIEGI